MISKNFVEKEMNWGVFIGKAETASDAEFKFLSDNFKETLWYYNKDDWAKSIIEFYKEKKALLEKM